MDELTIEHFYAQSLGLEAPWRVARVVIDGERNLTREMAGRFADACELTGAAREFFCELVEYCQSKTAQERSRMYERLARHRPFREARRLESAQAEWRGAFVQLELARVQGEYQRLTAIGAHSPAERERFHELSRRLAELKGATATAARPSA